MAARRPLCYGTSVLHADCLTLAVAVLELPEGPGRLFLLVLPQG